MRRLVVLALVAVACGPKNEKATLIYEEPVTSVWTGEKQAAPPPRADVPPPAPTRTAPAFPESTPAAPSHMPDANPPTQTYPQTAPQAYPQQPNAYPQQQGYPQQQQQPYPAPQAAQQPSPGGWRNAPQRQPPQPPPTGFPDPSVTTVVVPDQNPTTQTTLKKRTGWVRGGYD